MSQRRCCIAEVELAESVGSRRGGGRGSGGWKLVSEFPGDIQARFEQPFVEVEDIKRHWEGTVSSEDGLKKKKAKRLTYKPFIIKKRKAETVSLVDDERAD